MDHPRLEGTSFIVLGGRVDWRLGQQQLGPGMGRPRGEEGAVRSSRLPGTVGWGGVERTQVSTQLTLPLGISLPGISLPYHCPNGL